jgi:hypothetical protein
MGGKSGTEAPDGAHPSYYTSNASPGGGGGGSARQYSIESGWTTPGNGGSGLAYFYIGYKAPTTP